MEEAIAIVKKYRDNVLGMSMCEQIQRAVLNSIIEDLEAAQQNVQSDGACAHERTEAYEFGRYCKDCGMANPPRR